MEFCCCQKGLGLLDLRELFPCSRLSKIVYLLTLVSILARPEKRTRYRRDFRGVLLHSPSLWWLICSRDERVVATNKPYLVGVGEFHIFPRFAALWSTTLCFFNEGFSGGVCVQHLRVREFQIVVSDNSVKCNPWGRDFSVFFCLAELGRFVDNLVSAVELWLQTLATPSTLFRLLVCSIHHSYQDKVDCGDFIQS